MASGSPSRGFATGRWRGTPRPYLLHAPFLVLYAAIVLTLHQDALQGDEGRYLSYAQNLLNGFYSPPAPEISLWNGPGYPLLLTPFVALQLPLLAITLFNAVLQYGSVLLVHHALLLVAPPRAALGFSLFWACYYPAFQELPLIATEPLASFLAAALAFFLTKAFAGAGRATTLAAGFALGYLCLTKVAFCYVILALLPAVVLLWLLKRRVAALRTGAAILLTAGVVLAPYGLYTWQLTGRTFYWADSGGMVLYWMSTPFAGEYGDWNNATLTAHCTEGPDVPCETDRVRANHQKDYDEIYRLVGVERDDAFKRIALANIRSHPRKYLENCIANVGRLFFGFPASYTYQRLRTLVRIPPGAILAILMLACLPPTLLDWGKIAPPVRFTLAICGLYLGASALVSAYSRQLTVVVPLLLLWIAPVIGRTITIRSRLGD